MEIPQNPLVLPVHVIAKMINSPQFYFCVGYNLLPTCSINNFFYLHFNHLKLTGDIAIAFLFTLIVRLRPSYSEGKRSLKSA